MKNNRNIFILIGILAIMAIAAFLILPSLFTIWNTDNPRNVVTGPVRSDENIDPDKCNAIHNIDACSPEELEALGITLPEEDGSQYWMEMEDPGHGFRYAIPCFWRVEFPGNYGQGSGPSYPIYNYTEDFVRSFPRGEGVFENGGIKIDVGLINLLFLGYVSGVSLQEFATNEFNTEYSQLLSLEELTINDQEALKLTVQYSEYDTLGQYILFNLDDEVFLRFSAIPLEALESADVQGILNSFALSLDKSVQLPSWRPSDPPQGDLAPCIGINQ